MTHNVKIFKFPNLTECIKKCTVVWDFKTSLFYVTFFYGIVSRKYYLGKLSDNLDKEDMRQISSSGAIICFDLS